MLLRDLSSTTNKSGIFSENIVKRTKWLVQFICVYLLDCQSNEIISFIIGLEADLYGLIPIWMYKMSNYVELSDY